MFRIKAKKVKGKWERLRIQVKEYPEDVRKHFKYIDWYYNQGKENKSYTARYFGLNVSTIKKWVNRFDESNLWSLEEKTRRPNNVRQKEISSMQEVRIVNLRKKYIRLGKMKLRVLYEKEYQEKISSWKIQKVIEQYKLYYNPKKTAAQKRRLQRGQKKKRITEFAKQPIPCHLLQLDSIVKYWNGMKFYIITAIDHGTKIAFARMYSNHSSKSAQDFLKRLQMLLDDKIVNLQTDNGSEFHKLFDEECKNMQINHYWSRPRTSKDNAEVERFNRTLQEEFIQLGNWIPDPSEFNKKLAEWLIFYNFTRPHQTLDYLTPMEHYSNISKLGAMYSSRTYY